MLKFPLLRRSYAILLLLVLSTFLIYRGVIPAFTVVDSDFPNYYTAGKIAAQATDAGRLYDDAWFQEQIYANGINQPGKFSPFPPPTALIFIPLASFLPLTALQIVTTINIIALGFSILLLAKCFSISLRDSAILILLSGIGLANCFRLGQMYIVLSCLMLLGYYLFMRKRHFLSGLALGVLVPVKYYPIIFVLCFAWMKEWKVVFGSLTAILVVCLSSIAVLGLPIHEMFLRNVLGEHLRGNLTLQNPFSPNFQSFESLLNRFFVLDEILNPFPLVDSTFMYTALKTIIFASLCGLVAYLCIKARQFAEMDFHRALLGLIGILGLLLAPATATYHFVLLWLPMSLLLSTFYLWSEQRTFWLLILVYGAIGFIPYSFFNKFDGRGVFTVLAYPRLFLVSLLFILSASVLYSRRKAFSSARTEPKLL